MKDFEDLDKGGNLPNIYEKFYWNKIRENLEIEDLKKSSINTIEETNEGNI